jgi:tetratricopeptide (TPR) repeat protein
MSWAREKTMKRFGMRFAGVAAACALGLMSLGQPGRVLAQAVGSIHGHVTNPAGTPVTKGDVRLTTDKTPGPAAAKKYDYTFQLDGNGDFKGTGIKPGTYVAVAFQGGVSADFIMALPIAAGEDKQADFDMTRKEYIDKMSPEERSQLEDIKKANAAAMAANSKISNLNNLLKQARDDTKAGNFASAIKAMTDATTAKPDEALLWDTLGDAQLGDANAAAKAGKPSDPAVQEKFAAAVASYQKAQTLNAAAAKPNVDLTATVDNQLGQALGKTGKTKESAAAYEAAAAADKPKAAMYFYNEAATLFNANDSDGAASAADKAIASDPTRADAYYIKGQALIQKATVDSKTNKVTVPPGCVEAYQKYLELVPEGPRADEVKGILQGIGEPIKSSYKADKPGKK